MVSETKNSILFTGLFIFGILLSSSFSVNAINAVSYDGEELYELKCDGKTTESKTTEAKKTEVKTTEGKCGEGKCGEATSKEAKTGAAVKSDKNAKTTEGKCGEGKCGVS